MRGKAIFAILVTLFMMTPVQAGEVNSFQSQQEDPRQPSANNTTLYIWSDGMNNFWSHFNNNDTDSTETFSEEDENGVITIKQRYLMTPTLDKRLSMEVGGEVRGNFNVYFEGDSDSTDNQGPCQPTQTPNDCDWLNITLFKGQNKVYQHTETPWPSGQWKNIQFSYFIEEGNETWDGRDANPLIEITMKVKGDYQESNSYSLVEPLVPSKSNWVRVVHYSCQLTQHHGRIPSKKAETLVITSLRDTPGFTLVVASAAIAMAAFINQRRPETEE